MPGITERGAVTSLPFTSSVGWRSINVEASTPQPGQELQVDQGAGVVAGLAGALVLTRVMASLLFGVSATDVVTFSAVPLILVAIGLLASYLPARRATRIDPVVSLREE